MKKADVFSKLQSYCLAKVGAWEDYPWGHVVWKTAKGKLFAIASKDDNRVTLRSTVEKQAVLIMDADIHVASHIGRHGWVTIDVKHKKMLDFVLSLVDESYELVVGKKKT